MAEYKLVLSLKDGKSYQKEAKDAYANALMGKKIKDTIKGDDIGFSGYEFILTGGSDKCGFPMRWDVEGTKRKRILAVSGVGLKKKGHGIRQRKTVMGNTVSEKTAQINLKVTKEGKDSLDPEAAKPAEEAAPAAEGDAPAKVPAEKKKVEAPAKKEAPAKEEKAEAPAKEEAKEKPSKEEKKE